MSGWQLSLLGAYLACSAGLALYAFHGLLLLWLFGRRAEAVRADQRTSCEAFAARTAEGDWPRVTTQLPLYNEAEVVERLLDAVVAIDYPAGRHQIQVLDDSTDASAALVDRLVARHRAAGVDIEVLRRADRRHYKAGALAAGLRRASGELVAIFDADFVPPVDFLRRTVPLIVDAPRVACVQGRWDHLNRDQNWLTRAQSVGIDGHFAVEQGARAWNGLWMNFNGTAGIWRRAAIREAGGWSGDTLTEDLDLSYRAQLAGYEMVYALDVACPAEIPGTVDALKSQQRRWARGSIQTAKKLLGPIWRAPGPLHRKLAATFHLTHYSVSVLMTALAVLTLPVLLAVPFMQLGHWLMAAWTVVLLSALAPCVNYLAAGRTLGHGRFTLANIPGLIVLGSGLALNNASAVLAGLFAGEAPFVRTPKAGAGIGRYRPQLARLWWLELGLGLYCGSALVVYLSIEGWLIGVFLGFYTAGFLSMGWASRPWRRQPAVQALGAPAETPVRGAVGVES